MRENTVLFVAGQGFRQAGSIIGRVGDRAYSVASQGTVKFLGSNLAKKYGPSISTEPPTRLAAAMALASAVILEASRPAQDPAHLAKLTRISMVQQRAM